MIINKNCHVFSLIEVSTPAFNHKHPYKPLYESTMENQNKNTEINYFVSLSLKFAIVPYFVYL